VSSDADVKNNTELKAYLYMQYRNIYIDILYTYLYKEFILFLLFLYIYKEFILF